MKKLNIGVGGDYRKGWINLDISDKDIYGNKIKVDVKHNLNDLPYPYKDNQFEEILMLSILEHLDNPVEVLKEIHRISKPNANLQPSLYCANGPYVLMCIFLFS